VIHPNIDGIEGLGIFFSEVGIPGCHIIQTIRDSRNILPNLLELTQLNIVDSSFDGDTPSDFLTELQNGLIILRGGLHHADNIFFRFPCHSHEAREGATPIDFPTELQHVLSSPCGGLHQAGNILFRPLGRSRKAREGAKSGSECLFRFRSEQGDIRAKSPTGKQRRVRDGR